MKTLSIDAATSSAMVHGHFLIGVALGMALILASAWAASERTERRLYWSGVAVSTVFTALAFSPRGGGAIVGALGLFLLPAILNAYFRGPEIRFGGRVCSFDARQERLTRTDGLGSYSGVASARDGWWIVAAMCCFLAVATHVVGWNTSIVAGTAVVAVLVAGIGLQDGRAGYPPVRHQYLQAFVALAASIMSFGMPALGYLAGYGLGRRR